MIIITQSLKAQLLKIGPRYYFQFVHDCVDWNKTRNPVNDNKPLGSS